ncbi:MAG TPA: HAMP domain-containing sensor histidine kinase [Thermodesulfovibrionales bacterium]|nr:HAMP domain-containing sensor histidine kinase [Thermodesulfovibrionales bacterium]
MRTKLFLAFLVVIVIALVSNVIFERLTMNDFDEYIGGTKEDHRYWILASTEGSYQDGQWDTTLLAESIHWAMMLGFDARVVDEEGREIIDSHRVMESLPPAMKRRMESLIHIHAAEGEFEQYPLFSEGKELGTLFIRPVKSDESVAVKETIFKKRGKEFLITSFIIAGASAIAIAVFFSLYLSMPIKRLRTAAERVAKGDFSTRVKSVARDEIGNLADSFNYMAEALEKEEALRRHLTSNIAHELRTPLAVMKAQVEAITDGVLENTRESLETVRGEIERLTRLVEGIEDLTKAEASFFVPGDYQTVNLGEVLKGIELSMDPVFREKGLRLTLLDRGDFAVTVDLEKLERILRNVISNALKYTEEGGLRIDYGRDGKDFFVELEDTGSGIPDDEISKIFTRFYRGTAAPGNGAGVGLAIVKELVTVMGGRVEIRSRIGEGTTVRVWLPTKHPQPATGDERARD